MRKPPLGARRGTPRYAGASPRGRAGRGANVHTDAVCLPSWTLQVSGPKSWTFARRGPAERGVPLGDEFYGAEVWATELEPGDLLVFYNGWSGAARPPRRAAPDQLRARRRAEAAVLSHRPPWHRQRIVRARRGGPDRPARSSGALRWHEAGPERRDVAAGHAGCSNTPEAT